ncbi:MAG: hypothetical protein K0S47_1264 [Herbinix sp.]|jgi:processed acidic surface protein|nr:hypothetical protein [Herbinix sp.]
MKKLGALLLIISLFAGINPQSAMAAQVNNFEQELTQYLSETTTERGFEVTKEDVEESLTFFEMGLEDFTSILELKELLGDVIKSDGSNLTSIYEEYQLDQTSLEALLVENGEALTDYIYYNDLDYAVYFYTDDGVIEQETDFEDKLEQYVTEVSQTRGFVITKADVEKALANYDTSFVDFETVQEVKEFLGDVIKADLSNLNFFEESYGVDKEALLDLIEESGKDISDYIYVEDLSEVIWSSDLGGDIGSEFENLLALYPIILEKIDLTEEEIQRLEDYYLTLEEHFASQETMDRMLQVGERLLAFEEVEFSEELTEEQSAEIASIFEELFSIMKLHIVFTYTENGTENVLSIPDMMKLTDLGDGVLKVSLYTTDSQILADFIVSNEIITSIGDLIGKTTEVVEEVVNQPLENKPDNSQGTVTKTVKGGKLPKTASNYLPLTLAGIFIILMGIIMFRKVRNTESETIQK